METSYGTGLELVKTVFHRLIVLGKRSYFSSRHCFGLPSGKNVLSDNFSSPLK